MSLAFDSTIASTTNIYIYMLNLLIFVNFYLLNQLDLYCLLEFIIIFNITTFPFRLIVNKLFN
jgi:hypothetical protein